MDYLHQRPLGPLCNSCGFIVIKTSSLVVLAPTGSLNQDEGMQLECTTKSISGAMSTPTRCRQSDQGFLKDTVGLFKDQETVGIHKSGKKLIKPEASYTEFPFKDLRRYGQKIIGKCLNILGQSNARKR